MALQYSEAVRNAQIDQWEAQIGASPKIRFYDGSNPSDCATAPTATLIADGTLPADWMGAAAAGQKAIAGGPWATTGVAAAGAGTAILAYRIYDSAGTICHEQGTVTVTAGGGDIELDNTSIADLQSMNINTFTRTAGNA